MSALTWIRVRYVLRGAGLPDGGDAVQQAALLLRARGVPAIRDGGDWRVQADHPETKAWRASLAEQARELAAEQAEQAESVQRYGY